MATRAAAEITRVRRPLWFLYHEGTPEVRASFFLRKFLALMVSASGLGVELQLVLLPELLSFHASLMEFSASATLLEMLLWTSLAASSTSFCILRNSSSSISRLTSVLILFLMYLGLMALWRAVDDPSRAARAAAILTLVGALNLPIIKFSVDWWNTLHQPASVIRMGGSTLDKAFLMPLLVMAVGFSLLFVTLHLAAMRNEILRRRVRSLQMMQASQQAA